MARSSSVNGKLTDEAYARAALTYLAEPADRWLGQLLRVHGAAVTLAAIKSGRLPGTGDWPARGRPGATARPPAREGARGGEGRHGALAHSAARAAGTGAGARLRRVRDQDRRARVTRNGRGSWPTSGMTSPTRYGCAATRTCGSAACARSRSSARGPRPPTAPTWRPSSPRPSRRAAWRWSPAAPSASTPRRTGARSPPTGSPSPCSPAAWTCPTRPPTRSCSTRSRPRACS